MTAYERFLYLSGAGMWFVLAGIGFFWACDKLTEWLIDSVRFKAWVVGYLAWPEWKRINCARERK